MELSKRLSAVLLGICLMSGCGTISLNMTSNRFISPESGATHLEMGVQGVNHLTIVPDASARPPVLNSPNFGGTDVAAMVGGGFGFFRNLDFFASHNFGGVPLFGFKLQLLGSPFRETKVGNFSLSLTGAGGYLSEGSSDLFHGWDYTRKLWAKDASIIFGYRSNPMILIYGGPFVTEYQVQGVITQPAAAYATYPYSGRGLERGVHLGVELGRFPFFLFGRLFYRAELAVVDGKYSGIHRSKLDGGFTCGFQF